MLRNGHRRQDCIDCGNDRLCDTHGRCSTCKLVTLDTTDAESPNKMLDGRWVKRPGDAILVWQEAS